MLERELEDKIKAKGITIEEKDQRFIPLITPFRPDNEQKAWVELCNTDIPIRSVTGPAGSGKTFWAIASGLYLFVRARLTG